MYLIIWFTLKSITLSKTRMLRALLYDYVIDDVKVDNGQDVSTMIWEDT